ncbi:MAG: hypothetical protein O2819_02605 [Planctomycetota bacterium]|nr:hypothetical protein [Planctomycetota bacterium]MDA1105789.1 hypothetical protein [Planctomycetota bacterium]
MRDCACAILAGATAMSLIAGCTDPPALNADAALRDAAIPCAARVELLVTWPSQGKAERFEVHRGILAWGGGAAALQGGSTWKSGLTPAACESISDSLAALCADPPVKEEAGSDQDQFDLVLWCDGKSKRVIAPWPCSALEPVHALLADLARQRLTPALDKLPTAGQKLE